MRAKKSATQNQISFEAYGVKVGVRLDTNLYLKEIQERIRNILPLGVNIVEEDEIEHLLKINQRENGKFQILKDAESIGDGLNVENLLDFLDSQIRLTVAEYAVGRVFLHAGVVGWKGKALMIPASSFSGKTTLVAELIKRGALYYSDEYAVLDSKALVHSFPKTLSMRGIAGDYKQVEYSAKSFGAKIGEMAIPVGMVLICRFDKAQKSVEKFAPEILSAGQAMLEMIAHTIPIRNNPKFALEILNKISNRAIIAKCQRGEAKEFANFLIEYLDSTF